MLRQLLRSFIPYKPQPNNFQLRSIGSAGGETNDTKKATNYENNAVTKEQKLSASLKRSLPGITYISVSDISGGCGAMFEINVEAAEFKGLSTVKQHRLVTEALKSEIKEMHGIRIHTSPSETK